MVGYGGKDLHFERIFIHFEHITITAIRGLHVLPACKVYGLCDEGAAFCLMTLDICCTGTCMSDRRSVREDWYQIVASVVYECTMYLAARFFQGNFV